MNDLITAATSGLFVEVGKIIEHMKAQASRIADLERQLAEASAPAVEQQPVAYRITFKDFRHFSGAITSGRDYVQFKKPDLDSRFFEGCDSLVVAPLYTAPQATDTDKVREALNGLHNDIMNLPHQMPITKYAVGTEAFIAYKEGHRDARHAAAELAASMAGDMG